MSKENLLFAAQADNWLQKHILVEDNLVEVIDTRQIDDHIQKRKGVFDKMPRVKYTFNGYILRGKRLYNKWFYVDETP